MVIKATFWMLNWYNFQKVDVLGQSMLLTFDVLDNRCNENQCFGCWCSRTWCFGGAPTKTSTFEIGTEYTTETPTFEIGTEYTTKTSTFEIIYKLILQFLRDEHF